MKQFKRAKVVMLPTKVEAPNFTKNYIVKCIKEWTPIGENTILPNTLSLSVNPSEKVLEYYEAQHLYIISDDEIKEGDWKFDSILNIVIQHGNYTDSCKKIIATTDSSLNLPQPSQQFIQKYVEEYNKDEIITDVLVEYEVMNKSPEKLKFELEEGIAFSDNKPKINPKDNTITIKKVKNNWTLEEMEEIHISILKKGYLEEKEKNRNARFLNNLDWNELMEEVFRKDFKNFMKDNI